MIVFLSCKNPEKSDAAFLGIKSAVCVSRPSSQVYFFFTRLVVKHQGRAVLLGILFVLLFPSLPPHRHPPFQPEMAGINHDGCVRVVSAVEGAL